ncbi:MAG TPA: hypothetical protein VFP51_00115, partial [Nocardioidaceae bacterium]|nr:hypothetical protein [Nocardioidaceae bacterium]
PVTGSAPQPGTTEPPTPPAPPRPAPAAAGASAGSSSSRPSDDALDLGATVLPILAKTYGPQIVFALVALVIGYLLGRRRRG